MHGCSARGTARQPSASVRRHLYSTKAPPAPAPLPPKTDTTAPPISHVEHQQSPRLVPKCQQHVLPVLIIDVPKVHRVEPEVPKNLVTVIPCRPHKRPLIAPVVPGVGLLPMATDRHQPAFHVADREHEFGLRVQVGVTMIRYDRQCTIRQPIILVEK